MHEYAFDVTTVRLAIIVGVVVTTLFYERLQLTTGGAIVPGYLALFYPYPLFIAATLLIAWLTFIIVNRVLAQKYILYGRRKYEVEIMVGLALLVVFMIAARYALPLHPAMAGLVGIGFVVPAVIAHDMNRQGPKKTILAVLANTAIIVLFIYVFDSLLRLAPGAERLPLSELTTFGRHGFGYSTDLLVVGVFVSVAAGMLVFWKLGLRTSGFVTGAYLALVATQPLDVVFAVAVGLVTFFVVTRGLMPRMLIFGRRKLSTMILTAAILAWTAELAIRGLTGGAYYPWEGFHVITLIIPALIANDSQRQGLEPTLWGTAITSCAVFGIMNVVEAVRSYHLA